MNKVVLVALPFFIMLFAGIVYNGSLQTSAEIEFQSENVTVNQEQESFNVEKITLENIMQITIVVAVAVAICLALGIKVLGSGISGSVIPIVFVVTILTAVFFVLSGMSYGLFESIPIFGLPIYFGLIISYILGIVGLAVGGGGD